MILFIVVGSTSLFGVGKYTDEDFFGSWFFISGDDKVDSSQWVEIQKTTNGLTVRYKDGNRIYEGFLSLTQDGRYLKGVLTGLGEVMIGKIQSKSIIKHNGIGVDLSGGPDDILLGYFQKREVIEKLLKMKLPQTK